MVGMKVIILLLSLVITSCQETRWHHYGPSQGIACGNPGFIISEQPNPRELIIRRHSVEGKYLSDFHVDVASHGDDLSQVGSTFITSSPSRKGFLMFEDGASTGWTWEPWLFARVKGCAAHADANSLIAACSQLSPKRIKVRVYTLWSRWPKYAFTLPFLDGARAIQGIEFINGEIYILNSGYTPVDKNFLIRLNLNGTRTVTELKVPVLNADRNELEGLAYCSGKLYTVLNSGKNKSVIQTVYEIDGDKLRKVARLEAR